MIDVDVGGLKTSDEGVELEQFAVVVERDVMTREVGQARHVLRVAAAGASTLHHLASEFINRRRPKVQVVARRRDEDERRQTASVRSSTLLDERDALHVVAAKVTLAQS